MAGGADFTGANLSRARFEEALLEAAVLVDACLASADFTGACLARARLTKANLAATILRNADLTEADARFAVLTGAVLDGARLSGARISGVVGTGDRSVFDAAWVDISPNGDGSVPIRDGQIASLLCGVSGAELAPPEDVSPHRPAERRFLGAGDVLRDATLSFAAGCAIEVDSLLENCTIELGEDTELVIGKNGVLADCTIRGSGRITIHGKFYEGRAPGICDAKQVSVSAHGSAVAEVQQCHGGTQFAFEPGSKLRLKIRAPRSG
jgi:hypothetical protein